MTELHQRGNEKLHACYLLLDELDRMQSEQSSRSKALMPLLEQTLIIQLMLTLSSLYAEIAAMYAVQLPERPLDDFKSVQDCFLKAQINSAEINELEQLFLRSDSWLAALSHLYHDLWLGGSEVNVELPQSQAAQIPLLNLGAGHDDRVSIARLKNCFVQLEALMLKFREAFQEY